MKLLHVQSQDARLVSCGRLFFALSMMASGIQQLVTGHFVRLVPPLPAWLPWPSFWVYLTGFILIAAGTAIATAIATRHRVRWAAAALGALILSAFFLLHLPLAMKDPLTGFMWTNPLKALAMFGGVLILVGTLPEESPSLWGPGLLGLFLFVGGIQHFVYRDFVAKLVPAWIPAPVLWVYFTGAALIAGGVGINLRKTRRSAAILSGIMIFLWVVLLHIPRALADLHNTGETSGVFEALAFSGVALMLAGSRAGTDPAA